MRKWGIVISLFYALIFLGLIVPLAGFLVDEQHQQWPNFLHDLRDTYTDWSFWIPAGAILVSQALLLFLSVDTSQKRLKPRAHLLVSVTVGAVLTALLSTAVIWSLGFAIRGDRVIDFFDNFSKHFLGKDQYFAIFWLLVFWGTLWLLWAILFYFYFRNSSTVVRYRPPPSRLFRPGGHQFRHRGRHRHHAPLVRPQRPLPIQKTS